MNELERMLAKLKKNLPFLKEKYNVQTLELFGSYARNKPKKTSDLDLLVDFSETIDLFQFMELENRLSQLVRRKVDLVMKGALKSRLRDRVLKETIAL